MYAVCGCRRAAPAKVATEYFYPTIFSSSHCTYAVSVPTKPPRYWLPITIYNPYPQKKACDHGKSQGDMTKMLLVGSEKYPHGGPCTIRSSSWCPMPSNVPPIPVSSAYPICVTLGWAGRSYQMGWGGPQSTCHHCQCISLGHSLFTVE